MIIRYFDFGLYKATELKWIADILDKVANSMDNCQIEIYGFEACAKFYRNVTHDKKIKNIMSNKNFTVKLFRLAIHEEDNKMIKLYYHKNLVGHSIYDTKNNISSNYEEVMGVKFSAWLGRENINLADSFNIVRMNIEGAEWPLFLDIVENNYHNLIHIFCGDGYDVEKIGDFQKDKIVEQYRKLLADNNIVIHRYTNYKIHRNVDISELINEKLATYLANQTN